MNTQAATQIDQDVKSLINLIESATKNSKEAIENAQREVCGGSEAIGEVKTSSSIKYGVDSLVRYVFAIIFQPLGLIVIFTHVYEVPS